MLGELAYVVCSSIYFGRVRDRVFIGFGRLEKVFGVGGLGKFRWEGRWDGVLGEALF